ncbi:response regulator transcription factor [bacterium SCSIO 12741]|nr:response regulator transcription factor [bacterium SCSIO 12741]
MTINLLLCDDHPIFRQGIRNVLANEPEVTILGEASNGKECLELLEILQPDIVLMDIRMPEMNGILCTQKIKERYPDVKIIAMTQFDEIRLVKQMMKYGASGYVLKSSTHSELLKAFREVLKGKKYLTPEIENELAGLTLDQEPDELFPGLSEREHEIVRLICFEMSNKQIAAKLSISDKTVENHRSRIFRKIGVNNLAGLVRWAVNNGYDR